jgi:hypothetical protein
VPKVNVGSTSATLSFTFSGAVSSNAYEIDDSAYVTGLAIVSLLCVSTAFVTAGDTLIASAVMSVMPVAVLSRSTCTVRVGILAIWSAVLVVTPVATYTVHCVYAGSIVEPDFNVNAALLAAELLVVAANVVVSHPLVVTSGPAMKTYAAPALGSLLSALAVAPFVMAWTLLPSPYAPTTIA